MSNPSCVTKPSSDHSSTMIVSHRTCSNANASLSIPKQTMKRRRYRPNRNRQRQLQRQRQRQRQQQQQQQQHSFDDLSWLDEMLDEMKKNLEGPWNLFEELAKWEREQQEDIAGQLQRHQEIEFDFDFL